MKNISMKVPFWISIVFVLMSTSGCATSRAKGTCTASYQNLISLSGCATQESVAAYYESEKGKIERRAISGEITWMAAANNVRELDWILAKSANLQDVWVYGDDDAEYHAYNLALAEQLDLKRITFSQYDSSRISKFNQIRARKHAQNTQDQIMKNTAPRKQTCTTQNIGSQETPWLQTECQ